MIRMFVMKITVMNMIMMTVMIMVIMIIMLIMMMMLTISALCVCVFAKQVGQKSSVVVSCGVICLLSQSVTN